MTDIRKSDSIFFAPHFFRLCLKNVMTTSFKNASKKPGRPLRDTFCNKRGYEKHFWRYC